MSRSISACRNHRRAFRGNRKRGLTIDLLVNNAGFGSLGEFGKLDLARELNMIDLNVKSLVELTYRFLEPMLRRKQGAIINVASTAAFQAVPFMATYAATKAFVLSFSEALWEENRPHGIQVMALCPGVTETNFFEAARGKKPPARVSQTPEEVVDIALRGLARGKSDCYFGLDEFLYGGVGAAGSAFAGYAHGGTNDARATWGERVKRKSEEKG